MADSKVKVVKESKNDTGLILSFNASLIAYAHTFLAYSAFFSALIIGCWLHYYKIVQNSSYGYPDEWFPSVSAAIGDRYPERSVFQILIAVTSGPRFLLILFNFLILFKEKSATPYIGAVAGVIRTFTCGGWVYVTSTDDHDFHDIFMISYMVLTIPWTIIITTLSPKGSGVRKGRFYTGSAFFVAIIPLIYWFIQHKVHDRPGAYSIYAYFEWALILLDVGFDAWSIADFAQVEVRFYGTGITLANVKSPEVVVSKKSASKEVPALTDFTNLEFVSNLANSFILWSVITSFFLCVWYFPLWYMGISGYEATCVTLVLGPLTLTIPPLRNFYVRFPFITRVLTVLFGVASYKFPEPDRRLISVSIGAAFGVISVILEQKSYWSHPSKYSSFLATFMLGLVATVVAKFLNYSNNPIWPVMHKGNGGHNDIGIFLGLLGALFTPTLLKTESLVAAKAVPKTNSLFLSALGFGGLFFSYHLYLSDLGSLTIWGWEGFPIRGPTQITGAPGILAALALGALSSLKLDESIFTSWWYSALGVISAATVLYAKQWIGYAGAVGYTFYLISVTPSIFKSTIGHNPGLLFGLGFLVEIVLSLSSVWIVAYAFVPGGPLLRERTDIMLFVSHSSILAGVFNLKLSKSPALKSSTKLIKQVFTTLTVLLALSASTFIKRYPNTEHKPYNEDSRSFTTGIWCVHFGLDNDMWLSETRMANLIRDAQVDIIGLLETDTQRLIGGNRDFTQTIAEELGMYVDYGPGPNKHTWGAALLSKFPIVESKHFCMPSPVGELAPAILATLDIYGELVDIIVFHSGQEEDEEDRRLQSLGIQEMMGNSTRPLVLLSYLVTTPLEGNYNTYVSEKSRVYDIDSTDWDRWCEYILFRDLKKIAYARISRSTITDTELQIAKFKLLSDEEREENDVDLLYGNHYISEDEVDQNLRMPQLLRGDGVRGHRYHVFDEPRYFAQKVKYDL